MLFPALFFIMIFYLLVLFLSHPSTVGLAYSQHPSSYLFSAASNPERYIVVTGMNAKPYEQHFAAHLAEKFGFLLRTDDQVRVESNLILVGNPGSHQLMDELLTTPYSGKKPEWYVSKRNLFVLFNSEEQALQAQDDFLSVESPSPSSSSAILFIIFSMILVLCSLLFVEHRRHSSIDRVQERDIEHKREALEKYITKYEQEGHSPDQIREWLIKYGYSEELVDQSLEDVADA